GRGLRQLVDQAAGEGMIGAEQLARGGAGGADLVADRAPVEVAAEPRHMLGLDRVSGGFVGGAAVLGERIQRRTLDAGLEQQIGGAVGNVHSAALACLCCASTWSARRPVSSCRWSKLQV